MKVDVSGNTIKKIDDRVKSVKKNKNRTKLLPPVNLKYFLIGDCLQILLLILSECEWIN